MEREILVVFGENVHFREGKEYLRKRVNKTHPIQDYVSEATVNAIYSEGEQSQVWAVGGDAAGIGISEAKQIVQAIKKTNSGIEIDCKIFTNPLDTYYAAEAVKEGLNAVEQDVVVSTIFPITHRFRANQQLKQQGVNIKNKRWAEVDYIYKPNSTAEERNERRRVLRKILIRPNIYFDLMRELGLYGIGFIDRKGKLMRKVSEHFRKK